MNWEGLFTQKLKSCIHILMLFQVIFAYFPLWNVQYGILKNVYTLNVNEVQKFQAPKRKKKEKTFADNLLTPMSSKMSISFFLQSKRN